MRPICNSFTMGCLPIRGDKPRALLSGLSCLQVDKHGITILYHLHQCRPCISQDFHAKDGKGGIMLDLLYHVASGSEITPCNKIDKPLVVYRFSETL